MTTYLLKQYSKTMAMEAAANIGESRLFVFGYLLRLMRVLAMLAVWRTLLAGRGLVSGLSLPKVLTYTLASELFADLLSCRSGLESSWFDGRISTRFLRPMSIFHQFSSEMLGRAAASFVFFSVPLFLMAPLMGVDPRPASVTAGLMAVISIVAAVSVGLAIEYLIAGLGIAVQIHPYAINNVRTAVTTVFSGAFLPLALLPWHMGSWLAWLPFASQASAPLRIYTGTGDSLPLIATQCLWMALLWPAASWIWRVTREKMVSYGG